MKKIGPDRSDARSQIACLLQDIKAGAYVTDKQFKEHLTKAERGEYNGHLKSLAQPTPLHLKQALGRYLSLLRKADGLYNRAENMGNAKAAARHALHEQAEKLYYAAAENLVETAGIYPGIRSYFDRQLCFDHEHYNLSPCPDGMPRLATSQSSLKRQPTTEKARRNIQIHMLQTILDDIDSNRVLAKPRNGWIWD